MAFLPPEQLAEQGQQDGVRVKPVPPERRGRNSDRMVRILKREPLMDANVKLANQIPEAEGFRESRGCGLAGEKGTGAHWSGGVKAESGREAKGPPLGMLTFFQATDSGGGQRGPVP